jgi:hypothetical protein
VSVDYSVRLPRAATRRSSTPGRSSRRPLLQRNLQDPYRVAEIPETVRAFDHHQGALLSGKRYHRQSQGDPESLTPVAPNATATTMRMISPAAKTV